jgi:hypothetical protein
MHKQSNNNNEIMLHHDYVNANSGSQEVFLLSAFVSRQGRFEYPGLRMES